MFELLRLASVVLLPTSAFAIGFLMTVIAVSERRVTESAATFLPWFFVALVSAGQLVGDPLLEPLWFQYLVLVGGGLIAGVAGALLLVGRGARER